MGHNEFDRDGAGGTFRYAAGQVGLARLRRRGFGKGHTYCMELRGKVTKLRYPFGDLGLLVVNEPVYALACI